MNNQNDHIHCDAASVRQDLRGALLECKQQLRDAEKYSKEADAQIIKLRGYLEDAGWGECNIPACNCNGWHKLRQSREERELTAELDRLKTIVNGASETAKDGPQ